mgnify:CR=1 FL=1
MRVAGPGSATLIARSADGNGWRKWGDLGPARRTIRTQVEVDLGQLGVSKLRGSALSAHLFKFSTPNTKQRGRVEAATTRSSGLHRREWPRTLLFLQVPRAVKSEHLAHAPDVNNALHALVLDSHANGLADRVHVNWWDRRKVCERGERGWQGKPSGRRVREEACESERCREQRLDAGRGGDERRWNSRQWVDVRVVDQACVHRSVSAGESGGTSSATHSVGRRWGGSGESGSAPPRRARPG